MKQKEDEVGEDRDIIQNEMRFGLYKGMEGRKKIR